MQGTAGSKPCPIHLSSTFHWSRQRSQVKAALPPLVLAQVSFAFAAAALGASGSNIGIFATNIVV